ncbi:hypothetical protein NE237_017118 [Protea cynaroides]|uniref:SRR1-like domain-containing protein n=1 Tax=Protea cynaroides TaxID=273540 RepID=A0A9Q0K7F0_9MAGN|nr:hypothetical protein NE237_017118 [Protea cynaroides]
MASSHLETTDSINVNEGDIDWDSISESSYEKKKSNIFRRWVKRSSKIRVEDEIARLTEEMDISIKILERSKLYKEIHDKWQNNPMFQSNIGRVLGSDSNMLMVIYLLGSIESNHHSRFQLAFAVLLKRDFSHWISGIEVFDPDISSIDAKVMEALGCNVLPDDEKCISRQIHKPTLFYMPRAVIYEMGYIFEPNWNPSCLNQMILLTTSFENSMESWREIDNNPSSTFCKPIPHHSKEHVHNKLWVNYIEAIQKHTLELAITKNDRNDKNPLDNFSCHFFHLDQQLDMETGGG